MRDVQTFIDPSRCHHTAPDPGSVPGRFSDGRTSFAKWTPVVLLAAVIGTLVTSAAILAAIWWLSSSPT